MDCSDKVVVNDSKEGMWVFWLQCKQQKLFHLISYSFAIGEFVGIKKSVNCFIISDIAVYLIIGLFRYTVEVLD